MKVNKRPPVVRECSRFFQPEYDIAKSEKGKVIYTIYSAPQRFDEQLRMRSHGLQRFAILWGKKPQYEIFEIIGRALAADVLSPILMLYLSPEKLTIVGNLPTDKGEKPIAWFGEAWKEFAVKLQWQSWRLEMVSANNFESLEVDNPIRQHGIDILKVENFGVFEYMDEYSAFNDYAPKSDNPWDMQPELLS